MVDIDQIAYTTEPSAPSTLYLAAKTTDKWLSIYKLESNDRSSPSLNVPCSTSAFQRLCTSSNTMLATIKLKFRNPKGMSAPLINVYLAEIMRSARRLR